MAADDTFTLELTVAEAFALKDAVLCLWELRKGHPILHWIDNEDGGYVAGQLDLAEDVSARLDVLIKETPFAQETFAIIERLRAMDP